MVLNPGYTGDQISSGEAEFYAIVEGISRALGVQSLLKDLGQFLKVQIHTDSTAGKGIAQRNGIGKVRHLDTKYLWIQSVVKDRLVELVKILGKVNPADVGTKFLSVSFMRPLLEKIGLVIKARSEAL